jgi:hypothetical protein
MALLLSIKITVTLLYEEQVLQSYKWEKNKQKNNNSKFLIQMRKQIVVGFVQKTIKYCFVHINCKHRNTFDVCTFFYFSFYQNFLFNKTSWAMIIMIWLSYFIIIQDIKLLSEGQLKYKNKIKIVYKWTIFCPMGHSCADMFEELSNFLYSFELLSNEF